jgi:flagellar biosynthesis protein FlhA
MSVSAIPSAPAGRGGKDIGFAVGIVLILCLFFLPVPAVMIDFGLAFSIAISVLILMVSLWIQKPLEFSAFPPVLLVATILRLALNISTTRLILSHGAQGPTAAGYIIGGFAHLVMGGDFLIGIIVFLILVTINFLVITKGATRIAEVGARFTLDAIPGKQMAIDADLSAGLIDEKIAQSRRRELEEESAFFGSMDGASKFVRGDAIAGLIILAVNIFGGVVIGVTRHGLPLASAADVFTKLSVGDDLVTQIPALIISLAAGLLVAKGGTRGSADKAVIDQLSSYPNALFLAALLMAVLGVVPGLPFLPFAMLGGLMAFVGVAIPRRIARDHAEAAAERAAKDAAAKAEARASIKEQLKSYEVELVLSKELNAALLLSRDEIASRIAKMRRKFARQYGFVVPEIRLVDDIKAPAKSYQIKIHGTAVATQELRVKDWLVIVGDGPRPNLPGEEVREPAFGIRAIAIPEAFVPDARREGFRPIDPVSVLLTHLSEAIHNNLAQLLSFKDMRVLLERLEPEYKRLLDDISPSQISQSGLLATLKLLLAERVSIRNLNLILEAVAEIAPHARRPEAIAEHVRIRLSQQICGDLLDNGALGVPGSAPGGTSSSIRR